MSKTLEREKRRLERLKKELDAQQKKIDQDKAIIRKEKRNLDVLKKKLQNEQKDLKVKQNQLRSDKSATSRNAGRGDAGGGKQSAVKLKMTEKELADTKRRFAEKSKESRELKKELDQMQAELRVLKRKIKNQQGTGKNDDRKLRKLQHELRVLKKRFRMALKDLDKQRRYYHAQLRRFKDDQDKWIRAQRDLAKKKDIVVKYVFLDDVRTIKVYPKRGRERHKVRVKTMKGDQVVVYVEEAAVYQDGDPELEADADDAMDAILEELEKELKPQRKKKKKKKKKKKTQDPSKLMVEGVTGVRTENAEDEDETEDDASPYGEEEDDPEESEYEDDDEDDLKTPTGFSKLAADFKTDDEGSIMEDAEAEAVSQEQINELLQEMHQRTQDLNRVTDIYKNEPPESRDPELQELLGAVKERHDKFAASLERLTFDTEEIPDLTQQWQDEIFKLREAVTGVVEEAVARFKDEREHADAADESNPQELQRVNQVLLSANKQLLEELQGRVEDLVALNNIYFHPEEGKEDSSQSRLQMVESLKEVLENRHEQEEGDIKVLEAIPEDNIIDEFSSNNQQWRDLIYQSSQDHEQGEMQAEMYVEELHNRTEDLAKVLRVVAGDEPPSFLDDAEKEAEVRHDEQKTKVVGDDYDSDDPIIKDNGAWRDLLHKLRTEKDIPEEVAPAGDQDFKDQVIDALITELEKRREDLNQLREINTNIPEECEGLRTEAENRHNRLNEDLKEAKRAEKDADPKVEVVFRKVQEDNKQWQDALDVMMKDSQEGQKVKQRNGVLMQELNGRIDDLLKIRNLMEQRAQRKSTPVELTNAQANILETIGDRQDEEEKKVLAIISEDEEADEFPEDDDLRAMKKNDKEWKEACGELLEDVMSLPLASIDEEKEVDEPVAAEEPAAPEEDAKEEEPAPAEGEEPPKEEPEVKAIPGLAAATNLKAEEKEPDGWWLDKDPKRVEHIDSMILSPDDEEDMDRIGNYMNRIFADDDDPITALYVPQPEDDKHHKMSALFDGVLLSEMVNKIEPGFIDTRVLHKPDAFDPKPLSNAQVRENIQLLLSSVKALGCYLDVSDRPKDWGDEEKHFPMLKEVVDELHVKQLNKLCGLQEHPELMRLKKSNEDEKDVEKVPPQEWLQRWLNNKLGRPVLDPIQDYNADLYEVLKKEPGFADDAPCGAFADNPEEAAKHMTGFIRKNLGVKSSVEPKDLLEGNRRCQELLVAQVFDKNSGLAPLSAEEQKEAPRRKKKQGPEESMVAFINAILPAKYHVRDLTRDLSDGIVLCHLLDKLKDGVVRWKAVKTKPRHKFDKMANCNYGMGIIKKHFPFSLVGMSGQDIHDGHQKFIHTMLWQMMRYHSIKKLSELSFGGKDVTDEDILQWANLTISGLSDRNSHEISGFRDKSLTTLVFYLELLKAVLPKGSVREELINYDIPILANPRAPDKYEKERIENARYVISLVRMNGGELFVLPENLLGLDSKAVLAVIAAIMTIALTDEKTPAADDSVVEEAAQSILSGKGWAG